MGEQAGLLKLYVRTEKGVLFEVSPQIRIPRTFKRFCGLMCQLLHKMSIRASNGPTKLLNCIKNPVTNYLPTGARIVLLSVTGKLTSLPEYVPTLPAGEPVVFVAGAMAHGKVCTAATRATHRTAWSVRATAHVPRVLPAGGARVRRGRLPRHLRVSTLGRSGTRAPDERFREPPRDLVS